MRTSSPATWAGTSFDVSLIADGRSVLAAQTSIAFGLVIRSPMMEITTIGAGGGSIARVDRGGLLAIGPESAGSDPGPVAYGRGNDRPTVTDANVVLGRIDWERPIGSGLAALDVDAAARAIEAHVARPLGLGLPDAAEAIVKVATARMAGAIRLVSIERGHDPKRFALMPFGGGGALHAGALMKEVGLAAALVPRYPGVVSALGCTIADMRHDFVRTVNETVAAVDEAALAAEMTRQAEDGVRLLEAAGVALERIEIGVELDMAYVGQTHTVPVPLPVAVDAEHRPRPVTREAIGAAFDAAYRGLYGRLLAGGVPRILNLRTAVLGVRPKFDLAVLAPAAGGRADDARTGTRRVHVAGAPREAAVYDRLALPAGAAVAGPAILEQADATTFLEPDLAATVDRFGNLVIARTES